MESIPIAEGYYRLVKLHEDGNPFFPNRETVVRVDGNRLVSLTTGRSVELSKLCSTRYLYGPLRGPYDPTPTRQLPCVHVAPEPMREK